MRKISLFMLLPVLFIAFSIDKAYSDVNVGISADEDGIREFHLSIGTHYGVREAEIEKVRARSLPDDELAVVFFISNHTGISPLKIVDLRLDGMSWMEITFKYGLTADIYYVKFASDPGPPYGKAWGYYNKTPKKKWNEIRLADADVINMVNLRFLAEKYGCTPEKIVKMKREGKSFASMHSEFKAAKAEKSKQKAVARKDSGDRASGKNSKGKK